MIYLLADISELLMLP